MRKLLVYVARELGRQSALIDVSNHTFLLLLILSTAFAVTICLRLPNSP
jgi:hypothetical protein